MNKEIPLPYSVVRILSQEEMRRAILEEPKKWNVISIYSGGGGHHGIDNDAPILNDAESFCQFRFHDIDKPTQHNDGTDLILCEENHIKQILDYARGQYDNPLIVHCHAGISRSSAITFLIYLDYFKDKSDTPVEDALQLLIQTKPVHLIYPNRHIINLGVNVIAKDWEQEVTWMRELYNSRIFDKLYGKAFIQKSYKDPEI